MAFAKEVVAAGFVVYRRMQSQIQYLLLQTSYGENHWSPPKGHVDPGENEMETALRETLEEAGLHHKDFNVIKGFQKVLRYMAFGKPKRVVYWLAELKDPNTAVKLSDEHKDYKWLELKTALELAKFEDMQETLTEAEAFLQSCV